MQRLLAFCLAVLIVGANARADRTHDITLDDYFTIDVIIQHQVAPDGMHVTYTLARWDKETDGRRVDLWVVAGDTNPPAGQARRARGSRRLTFDHAGVASPRWSADGKTIYFLARRKRDGEKAPLDGTTQVWRIGVDGGEPFAVTRVTGGVQAFDLAPDGRAVFYQVGVEKVTGDFAALKRQFKGIDYGHGVGKVSELWRLDLDSWKAERVYDKGRVIREFTISPDGKRVAMITTPDETVVTFEGRSRVDVFDLATREVAIIPDKCFRTEAPSPYGWLEHLAWSPSNKAVAFNVVFDGYPAEIIVADQDGTSWKSRKVRRPDEVHVRGYGSPLCWRGESKVGFLAEETGLVRLAEIDVQQGDKYELSPVTKGHVVVESLSGGGHMSLLMNDVTHTPDLFYVRNTGRGQSLERLTNVNAQVDTWKIPEIRVYTWKARDGTIVSGILELPPGYKGGTKLPLVVCIHGGPTTADRLHLQYWIYGRTLLPAKGYAVLCPNYRGSTGYGDKFLTQLVGNENDIDVGDILSGVDSLVERGIADPERLGVMGWSNGGYLTNCVITRTTRFKAASSGAGIVDTVMEWGANDEPAYGIAFKKGFPWSQPDLYRKTSPTYALDKVRTPTLIHVGGSDERCPPGHSRMLYRALKEYVKVPTELLVYPGESHGIMKYSNRKAKMEWDLAWFDRYILGKTGK